MNKLSLSIAAISIALASLLLTINFSLSYVNNIGNDNIVNLLLAILVSLLFIIMSLYVIELNNSNDNDNLILP